VNRIVEGFRRILRDEPRRPLLHLPLPRATLTAEEIWEAGLAQRSRLERLGLGREHLLIYAGGNRPEAVALWLACGSLGLALMPVDAGTTLAEVEGLARRFGASAVVIADGTGRPADVGAASSFAPGLAIVLVRNVVPAPQIYGGATVLKVTSGTSGEPRATFTTDVQLVNDAAHIMSAMDIRASDCQMGAISLSHAYGIGNLILPLLLQGTAMVLRESFVPHQFAADARAYGARVFPGVPFMFDHFTAHLSPGAWPAPLERLISAGARLETSTVRAFHGSFGLKIHSFYGTSETGGIAYDDAADIEEETTVGRPMPGVRIALLPEEGAPEGGGRVHVAGDAVASGYAGGDPFSPPEAGGGFLTGDVGRFTARGHLVLSGRVSSFINVAGRKVQPEEVEAVLRSMPGIDDARVVGAPHPTRGQQIVACIVARGGDPGALAVRQYCGARLAPHKIPRTVIVMDRIPLTERGKTDRRRIEAAVAGHLRGMPGSGVL
jgi:long-chain acyl-CoA synthetase